MPNIKQHLTQLDAIVDNVFIPAITDGHLCTTDERLVLSLLVKKARRCTPYNRIRSTTRRIAIAKEEQSSSHLQQLRENVSPEQLRANDLAMMKGGSRWLTTLPLKSQNFSLNKREFYEELSLRYRWTPKHLPSMCPCGKRFDVDHAMSCLKGFVHRRHDDVRDLFATFSRMYVMMLRSSRTSRR